MIKFKIRPPDKKRFLNALNHIESEDISYFEAEFPLRITSKILGKKVNVRSYLLPADEYVEFLKRVGIDVAYLNMPWPVGRKEARDEKGQPYYIDGLIRKRSDLKEIVPPDLGPVKKRIEEFLKAAEGTGLGWIYMIGSANNIESAIGYEDYYVKLYEDPGFIEEFMDRYEEYSIPLTELILRYNPDAVFMAATVCGKSGMVMNMEHAEKFIFSRIAKQISLIKAKGIPAIIHSDGDNTRVMDRWIELGFSGFHPVEPCKGFDIYNVKKQWGDKISLCGNIDVGGVLSKGTPEEVSRDTLMHIEKLSPGGGYICSSSHDIGDNVPLKNLKAMIEAVSKTKFRANPGCQK